MAPRYSSKPPVRPSLTEQVRRRGRALVIGGLCCGLGSGIGWAAQAQQATDRAWVRPRAWTREAIAGTDVPQWTKPQAQVAVPGWVPPEGWVRAAGMREAGAGAAAAGVLRGAAQHAQAPVTFVNRSFPEGPLGGLDAGYCSAPAFVDIDGDGDLDLLSRGGSYGYDASYGWCNDLRFFENTGSATDPSFEWRAGSADPFGGISFPEYYNIDAPALADIDGDGDADLFVGDLSGISFFENEGTAASPLFTERKSEVFGLPSYTSAVSPALADLDGDGDADLFFRRGGGLTFFENVGTPTSPFFEERPGAASPFSGIDLPYGDVTPALADVDGDGDLDLISGSQDGIFHFFENTGTATNPFFAERTGSDDLFEGFDVGRESAPALADLDGDGDLDLLSGRYDGTFRFFENVGTPAEPAFRPPFNPNPFAYLYDPFFPVPTLVDLDGDGDFDLVSVSSNRNYYGVYLSFFENTGSATEPSFEPRASREDPLEGIDLEQHGFVYGSTIAFADLDGDGDMDAVVGDIYDLGFRLFENTGSATDPSFEERTGRANPLEGLDINDTLAFVDVDGDGDADLFGLGYYSYAGSPFKFFENVGTPTSPSFAERIGLDELASAAPPSPTSTATATRTSSAGPASASSSSSKTWARRQPKMPRRPSAALPMSRPARRARSPSRSRTRAPASAPYTSSAPTTRQSRCPPSPPAPTRRRPSPPRSSTRARGPSSRWRSSTWPAMQPRATPSSPPSRPRCRRPSAWSRTIQTRSTRRRRSASPCRRRRTSVSSYTTCRGARWCDWWTRRWKRARMRWTGTGGAPPVGCCRAGSTYTACGRAPSPRPGR